MSTRALERARNRRTLRSLGFGKSNGAVIYEGPSRLDGAPIVVVVTGLARPSKNAKTRDMLQTWILRADVNPVDAVRLGADESICGQCVHRNPDAGDGTGRTCYVEFYRAPLAIYLAYRRGSYPVVDAATARELVAGFKTRFGAYGDPGAAPTQVWRNLASACAGHTGYTHQWTRRPSLRRLCMASVESNAERVEAWRRGFRTFSVSVSGKPDAGEVKCPAFDAGASCATCGLCSGAGSSAKSISAPAHGFGAGTFKKAAAQAAEG